MIWTTVGHFRVSTPRLRRKKEGDGGVGEVTRMRTRGLTLRGFRRGKGRANTSSLSKATGMTKHATSPHHPAFRKRCSPLRGRLPSALASWDFRYEGNVKLGPGPAPQVLENLPIEKRLQISSTVMGYTHMWIPSELRMKAPFRVALIYLRLGLNLSKGRSDNFHT